MGIIAEKFETAGKAVSYFFEATWEIFTSTLSSIFRLALYELALTGKIPQGFTPELIKKAITAGK